MIKRDLFVSPNKIKLFFWLSSVSLVFLPFYNMKSYWNGIRVEFKELESGYRGKFQRLFDQEKGKLVRVSGNSSY